MRSLDLNAATWHKSSYSNQDGGQCLEVAAGFDGVVPVRDSKSPRGPVLAIATDDWTSFVSAVKTGALGA